jgi:peptidoglycan L-alanyl-D-glutamate endopeptidase CwlK
MPEFGERSRTNLSQAHPDLQRLFARVIQVFDCAVICGHRGQAEQEAAFHAGTSTKQWPDSKHNQTPSLAVDVVPFPIDWNDIGRIHYFAGVVMGIAHEMGINIRWGGDWDQDTEVRDQTFHDLPHFELI